MNGNMKSKIKMGEAREDCDDGNFFISLCHIINPNNHIISLFSSRDLLYFTGSPNSYFIYRLKDPKRTDEIRSIFDNSIKEKRKICENCKLNHFLL